MGDNKEFVSYLLDVVVDRCISCLKKIAIFENKPLDYDYNLSQSSLQ